MRKSRNERFHDRVAPTYDRTYDTPYWDFIRALLWEYLKPFRPRDASAEAVDLGCGTGEWGLRLAKSGFRTTFVDLSSKMLDQARDRAQELGFAERCAFVKADLCDLSALAEHQFALAVAMGDPLSLAPDPLRAARQVSRLIAPGGSFCGTVDNFYAALEHHAEKGIDELERFARDCTTDWLTHDPSERFPTRTFTPEGLSRLLADSGFEDIAVSGYSVLPLRGRDERLSDSDSRRRLLALEERLARNPSSSARAAHLFFSARRISA
jgi:ubiquinone/menaquinone biosynthesis C-methylase UbiE